MEGPTGGFAYGFCDKVNVMVERKESYVLTVVGL
jgi:hypothetical protein